VTDQLTVMQPIRVEPAANTAPHWIHRQQIAFVIKSHLLAAQNTDEEHAIIRVATALGCEVNR